MDLVKRLGCACARAERIIIPQLMLGTPLEKWAHEHVLMKLLSAHHYEEHVQFVTQLAVLWRYGGIVLAPGVVPTKLMRSGSWVGATQQNRGHQFAFQHDVDDSMYTGTNARPYFRNISNGFYAMSAHSRASFVHFAMEAVQNIAKQPYSPSSWPLTFDWDLIMLNSLRAVVCPTRKYVQNTNCPAIRLIQDLGLSVVNGDEAYQPSAKQNFGTLTYNARRTFLLTRGNPGMNIGDEMQGLAGIQFLPYVNAFIERDRLDIVCLTNDLNCSNDEYVALSDVPRYKPTKVTVFLNAWYASSTFVWPPPAEIDPILVAMHFEEGRKERIAKERSYLVRNGLVGARDEDTDSFLSSHGINSVFAGCLTLTLHPLDPERKYATGEVLMVDVNEDIIADRLPSDVMHDGIRLSHKLLNRSIAGDRVWRYYHAFAALRRYSRAKVVITQRLHVALPSAAMGVPVVFLMSNMLPGGGGKSAKSRIQGLDSIIHTFDVSDPQAIDSLQNFDWKNPPRNPGENLRVALRNKLVTLVKCHEDILDSAKMYGLVSPTWEAANKEGACGKQNFGPKTIHIAVALDNKWISILPTWLTAIVKNNEGEQLAFHFLTDSMKPAVECIIAEAAKRISKDVLVFFHKADHVLNRVKYRPSSRHEGKISRVTQARLYLSSFLSCLERVLYLDMDVLVLRSLRKLWDSDIVSPCGILARTSTLPNVVKKMASHLQISEAGLGFAGFNAGVMLLDLRRLRESDFEETIVSHFGERIGANDQIVYNLACNGTHDSMPAEWNIFESARMGLNRTSNDEDDWAIVHFAGSLKPFLKRSAASSSSLSFKLWKEYQTSISKVLDEYVDA